MVPAGSTCTPGLALCLARYRDVRGVRSAARLSRTRLSSRAAGRIPITTPHTLHDDVLSCDASDGSFLRNPVITLSRSTVGCRAPACHIVGSVLRTHSASGPVPVSLATCTLLTGYLITYSLLMRFLAHAAVDMLNPEPPLVERLVGQVLLQGQLPTAGLLRRHEDRHLRKREGQEAQIL